MTEALLGHERGPSIIEQLGPVSDKEFASVVRLLQEPYERVVGASDRKIVSLDQVRRVYARFEPEDVEWQQATLKALGRGEEPWLPLREGYGRFPKGLQILSGFIETQAGDLVEVPSDETLESQITLAEVLGGFPPLVVPQEGELGYKHYLGTFAWGYRPQVTCSPNRPSAAAEDREPLGHPLGAIGMGPYLKRIAQNQAGLTLIGALQAEKTAIEAGKTEEEIGELPKVEAAKKFCLTLENLTPNVSKIILEAMEQKVNIGDLAWRQISGFFRPLGVPIPHRFVGQQNVIHFEVVAAQLSANVTYLRDSKRDLRELPQVHRIIEEEMGVADNFQPLAA